MKKNEPSAMNHKPNTKRSQIFLRMHLLCGFVVRISLAPQILQFFQFVNKAINTRKLSLYADVILLYFCQNKDTFQSATESIHMIIGLYIFFEPTEFYLECKCKSLYYVKYIAVWEMPNSYVRRGKELTKKFISQVHFHTITNSLYYSKNIVFTNISIYIFWV